VTGVHSSIRRAVQIVGEKPKSGTFERLLFISPTISMDHDRTSNTPILSVGFPVIMCIKVEVPGDVAKGIQKTHFDSGVWLTVCTLINNS